VIKTSSIPLLRRVQGWVLPDGQTHPEGLRLLPLPRGEYQKTPLFQILLSCKSCPAVAFQSFAEVVKKMFSPSFKRPEAAARIASGTAGYRLEVDVSILMRDGIHLATDLYFPAKPGIYPIPPYGKHQSIMLENKIYLEKPYPSHILLPVIP
jgi:hypothetical protein